MIIELRVCDLCEGDMKQAVATYIDCVGEEHDICNDCLKLIQKEGYIHKMLPDDPDAEEIFRMIKNVPNKH